MNEGFWGLQATVGNSGIEPLDWRRFRDEMQRAAAAIYVDGGDGAVAAKALIACMRYANHIGVPLEEIATELIKRGEL